MKITLYGKYIIGEHYWTDGTTGEQWALEPTPECPDEFTIQLPDGSTAPEFTPFARYTGHEAPVIHFDVNDGGHICPGYLKTVAGHPEHIQERWGALPPIYRVLKVVAVNGQPAYMKSDYLEANSNEIRFRPNRGSWESIAVAYDRYGVPTVLGEFKTTKEAEAALDAYRGEKMS